MNYTAKEIKFIPNDQYSCTECGLVPEIVDIDYESGLVVIKCSQHGEKKVDILDYFNKELPFLYYSAKCDFNRVDQKTFLDKNEYFFDCKSCDKICCPSCSYHHKGHTLIKVNEKNNM